MLYPAILMSLVDVTVTMISKVDTPGKIVYIMAKFATLRKWYIGELFMNSLNYGNLSNADTILWS